MPKITNVKFSFKIPPKYASLQWINKERREDLCSLVVHKHGFITLRVHSNEKNISVTPVFIIFPKGHVNCTKIADMHCVSIAMRILCRILRIPRRNGRFPITKLHIDNISAFTSLHKFIDLNSVSALTLNDVFVRVRYNPEIFPCVYIRHAYGGSIGLFSNGMVTFVGAKSRAHIDSMWRELKNLIKHDECE